MAVPAGIPVEQSIKEIDAEIRMEDIRQSPAARLKMDHFHAAIKKNLMDKKLTYEAEHRKEILDGLRHMKRRLPTESGTSLVKKLEILAVNLECTHRNENTMFLMKSHSNDDLTLSIRHNNDQAIDARIYYFGDEFPTDEEITWRINNNEWEELRVAIQTMLRAVPCSAPKDMKQKLSRYRLSVERSVMSKWKGGASATISQVNESSVGWPAPGTCVRPMRVFLYGEPGVEFEMKEKGITAIDAGKGEIPYAEIVIMEWDKEKVFSCNGTTFSYCGVVKLELSCRWVLSAYTVEQLKRLGARPASVLQKTNLMRLMSNCQMKEGDLELVGKELGRDVRYLVKGEESEMDVIVESLVVEDVERLEEILLALHHQAVFNSSWESIVASCCVKNPSTHLSIQFEMNTRGCNWEIVFTGDGSIYHVRLSPSTTRHWSLNIVSHHNDKLSDVSDEVEGAFNGTWSLSKCLSYLVDRLGLSGYEWKADATMDTSLPLSDCSLQQKSKVGLAWLRKDIPPIPPPIKHEYRVVLPKGRCPLLRMMREVKPRKPLKVARARPQLSNPTVPPLRVNRLDAGLPPLQPHSQTPFTHIENMVKGVDDGGRSINCPMGSMEGGIYGHTGYPAAAMGGNGMGVASLMRAGMAGMGGVNPIPPYASPQQQQEMMMRQQQLMRQQSNASMMNQGVFEFQDDSRGSSPSSINDFSPGYSNQFPGYAPPQSPLVRGGGTTKARRPRGRKAGNVGDRTPGSSIDSPSSSGVSPDNKRPKSGPGSRGGRGGRGKRGISMDQSMSPFQRSLSEMSNSMSSPLAASITPLYSQQSFDEGTSDEECDPPPFSRSLSSVTSTSATTVVASSRLSSTASSSSPLATPASQPLPPSPIISVVPSPLAPPISSSSTPTLVSVLSAPSQPPPVPSAVPSTMASSTPPSIPPSLPTSTAPSLPPTSASSSPHSSSTASSFTPSLVRRKSSLLESIVGQLTASQSKKRALTGPTSDLFDTGLEDSSPQSSSQPTAPLLHPETKTESPKKEGADEKIVLKLKSKSTKEPKKKNPEKEKIPEKDKEREKEKEKEKEKKKEAKSGEDRKRKADSSSKDKKEREVKKSKTVEPPLIGGNEHVTKMGMLKGFKIPKTKGPGDLSIASSSSSLAPALPSPSLIVKPTLATPPTPRSSTQSGGPPPPFRSPAGGPIKGSASGRQPPSRPPKSILKSSGPPGPPSGGGRHFPPERKTSHPPYHEPPRTRQPSGGSVYPPSHPPSTRRPLMSKGVGIPPPTNNPNWVPIRGGPSLPPPSSSTSDGPPTLTPAISGPNLSSRLDRPPTLESNLPSRSIIDDSPASPDGLHIVDD